jgi:hypothetical protein
MALPSVQQELDQGAVQATEQLAAGAPPPLEPTPTQADEAALAAVSQSAPVSGTGNMPQTGYTVKNPYTLMPAAVNMRGAGLSTPKSQVERSYDIGRFWQVLASDPRASELTRFVARSLVGGKK